MHCALSGVSLGVSVVGAVFFSCGAECYMPLKPLSEPSSDLIPEGEAEQGQARCGFHLRPVVRNLLSRGALESLPMRAPKARPSPFSLPVLHTGSTVRPRTRLLGLACRLPTSAAGRTPPSRALPAMPRRTFLLFILRASYTRGVGC